MVNEQQSQLTETIYLEALFNMAEGTVALLSHKIASITWKIRSLRSTHLSASRCQSLIGTMAACILMVPWEHWHLRHSQLGFPS